MEYEWSSIIKSQKSLSLVVCKNYCKNLYVYCMPVHCVFQLVCIHWLSIIIDCTDEHTASSMQLILAVPLPTLLGSLRVLALVSKCTWQVWCWWAKACRNCICTCIHIPWYYMVYLILTVYSDVFVFSEWYKFSEEFKWIWSSLGSI